MEKYENLKYVILTALMCFAFIVIGDYALPSFVLLIFYSCLTAISIYLVINLYKYMNGRYDFSGTKRVSLSEANETRFYMYVIVMAVGFTILYGFYAFTTLIGIITGA